MEPVTFPIAENSDYIWFCLVMIASAILVDAVFIMMLVKGHVKGRILKTAEKITYGILMVVLTLVFYLGAAEVYMESQGSVTVTQNSVKVSNGLFYPRDFAFDDLDIAATQVVNIHRMGELYPAHRTNGTGLGDLWSGNFRTRNGTKAYLLVSSPENSVMLRHKDGMVIYLSPNDPQVFRNLVIERASK